MQPTLISPLFLFWSQLQLPIGFPATALPARPPVRSRWIATASSCCLVSSRLAASHLVSSRSPRSPRSPRVGGNPCAPPGPTLLYRLALAVTVPLAIPYDACPAQPHSLGDDPNEQTLSLRPNPRHSFASSDRFAPSITHATKRKAPSSRLCDQTLRRELERSVGFDTERIARSLARSARRSGTRRRALFFWSLLPSTVHIGKSRIGLGSPRHAL